MLEVPAGYLARGDKLLARASSKKKSHITQPPKPPKMATVHTLPHGGFLLFLHQKSCCENPYRTEIRARTPRPMWSELAAQRIAVALWPGRWRASHRFGGLNVGAFWGVGCFNSTLQYPARVDRTGIRVRTPRSMWSKPAAQCIAVALWSGRWRATHRFGGLNVEAFGGGGDASNIHSKSRRRTSLVSYFSSFFEFFSKPL